MSKSPTEGDYSFTCKNGFEGQFCRVIIEDCEENDATCEDGDIDYTCSCTEKFAGKNCDVSLGKMFCFYKVCFNQKLLFLMHNCI